MPKESLVKIIPRPREKPSRLVNFLFLFSLILILSLLVSYWFLGTQTSSLQSKKQDVRRKIEEIIGERRRLKEDISEFQDKIGDFRELFQNHKFTSIFFDFLESSCHPKVQFTSLGLDTENSVANLTGKTENFKTLGEQLLVFKGDKNIKGLKASNISLDRDGKVKFNLTFTFSSSLLKK